MEKLIEDGIYEEENLSLLQRQHEEEILFKKEPRLNVISKETYEERSRKVFNLLWKTLAKSFGPYGAPTLIFNYPYSHVTKDGFTIMKNLSMDTSDQLVDQSISNMASDICGRLNYTVGDGTTSAVIATNSIYQNYLKQKEKLESNLIMPRDIMSAFNRVKEHIIEKLHNYVTSIQSDDPEELYKNIYKVVYISSNGDEFMSDSIAKLYSELRFPGITCELATDGITRSRLIEGYNYNMSLCDQLYINSDDRTLKVSGCDIIILAVKVTKELYKNILVPLNEQSKLRGRKLIVCASIYDQVALAQTIRRDLNNEHQKTKDINMVLCTYSSISDHTRKLAEDFAMLCNTVIIDRELKNYIEKQLDEGASILSIFNLDHRDDIDNLICVGTNETGAVRYINSSKDDSIEPLPTGENAIRLGYIGKGSIGLKNSLLSDFYYNQNRYDAMLRDAEMTLKDVEDRYKKLGTFNVVVNQAQQRYYSLKLKMGLIEVGADSELSQRLAKDAVDDAVKAAASAFNNGVINGCNVDMIRAISDVKNDYMNLTWTDEVMKELHMIVLNILLDGFKDVYKTVLANAFPDLVVLTKNHGSIIETSELYTEMHEPILKLFRKDIFNNFLNALDVDTLVDTEVFTTKFNESVMEVMGENFESDCTIHELLIELSAKSGMVFDVSKREFSYEVINSTQTDEEILIATIDLIALLITGNQMLITQKHNF